MPSYSPSIPGRPRGGRSSMSTSTLSSRSCTHSGNPSSASATNSSNRPGVTSTLRRSGETASSSGRTIVAEVDGFTDVGEGEPGGAAPGHDVHHVAHGGHAHAVARGGHRREPDPTPVTDIESINLVEGAS